MAYLKNRSPSEKGVSHYEIAIEEKQNLKKLRVIGSQAWVHIPKKMRKKLNDIAYVKMDKLLLVDLLKKRGRCSA